MSSTTSASATAMPGSPTHPGEPLATFVPQNANQVNPDWPFRSIDHVLIRCGDSGGPTLLIRSCHLAFDHGPKAASDHYGLVAELVISELLSLAVALSCTFLVVMAPA